MTGSAHGGVYSVSVRATFSLVVCLLLAPACRHSYYSRATRVVATASSDVAAVGVRAVRVEALQGTMTFVPSQDDSISATVSIGPARGAMGRERDCPLPSGSAEVRARRRQSTVLLGLADEPGDQCVVAWEVAVPRGILVEATLTVGDIDVRELANPAVLRSKVGTITVDGESASVSAETEIGGINVRLRSPSYALVDLETNVGDVELELDGGRLERRRPAGTGDALSLKGPGSQRIVLRAGVGDVRLALGADPGPHE